MRFILRTSKTFSKMAAVSLSVLRNFHRSQIFSHLKLRFTSNFTGYRPRRSLLYVPGNETKKVVKAAGLTADVVVLDCEDGVAQSSKVSCKFHHRHHQC